MKSRKADFLVIGAMKCGTSTVCAYLEDHPQVYMVPRCEPNFFCHDFNFEKGVDWYQQFFPDHTDDKIRGEGSNDYSFTIAYPQTAARIAAYNPNIKLIYMVRDPIERIYSAWVQHRCDNGDVVPWDFKRAVKTNLDLYISQSKYWQNLSVYREQFSDAQIFVGLMTELSENPGAFFSKLSAFLGVTYYDAKRPHANPSASKRVPNVLYSAINKIRLAKYIKNLLPKRHRELVKNQLLSTKARDSSVIDEEFYKFLRTETEEDSKRLLHYLGKDPDLWFRS